MRYLHRLYRHHWPALTIAIGALVAYGALVLIGHAVYALGWYAGATA